MKYEDKDKLRDSMSRQVYSTGTYLHPEDRVVYYRELAERVTKLADQQDRINIDDGVPEK